MKSITSAYGFPIAVALFGVALLASLVFAMPAQAKEFGMLYLNDETVRTFGVPAHLPHGGTDPLYVVTNGVDGQIGIAGVGPGEQAFSGGDWAVYEVTFTVDPYLLTSDEDVAAAQAAGDVIVERTADADFRCPVLP